MAQNVIRIKKISLKFKISLMVDDDWIMNKSNCCWHFFLCNIHVCDGCLFYNLVYAYVFWSRILCCSNRTVLRGLCNFCYAIFSRLLVTDNTDIVTRRIKLLMMVLIKYACTKYILVHLISIISSHSGYAI